VWQSRIGALRTLCNDLEDRLAILDADAVAAIATKAADAIAGLARDLDVALPAKIARTALRCDLRLPFDIELGPELREAAANAIAAYDGFLRSWSPATPYRIARRKEFADLNPGGLRLPDAVAQALRRPAPLAWTELAAIVPQADALGHRIAAWEAMFNGAAADAAQLRLDPRNADQQPAEALAPLGCLLATPWWDSGPHFLISGALDDISPLYARLASLLNEDAPGDDPLLGWVRGAFARLEEDCGVDIAEIKTAGRLHPNLYAGPTFAGNVIELWSAGVSSLNLDGARVTAENGLPLLRLPGRQKPLLVFACTAADVARGDPFAQLLLLTSFRDAPGVQFRAANLLFEAELRQPRWSPRISLPSGDVVRPRRTVLTGASLEVLSRCRTHSARYLSWQKLAAAYNWPPLLRVTRDNGPPLLVRRDSPLALEAAFAGIGPETRVMVIDEVAAHPWLVDAAGQRFIAEFAIAFERHDHLLVGCAAAA
jgi:hypothetical protein